MITAKINNNNKNSNNIRHILLHMVLQEAIYRLIPRNYRNNKNNAENKPVVITAGIKNNSNTTNNNNTNNCGGSAAETPPITVYAAAAAEQPRLLIFSQCRSNCREKLGIFSEKLVIFGDLGYLVRIATPCLLLLSLSLVLRR